MAGGSVVDGVSVVYAVNGSCGEINGMCMPPHPHAASACMEPCKACGAKHSHHTETDKEKRCKRQKQSPPFAVMWEFKSRHTHIKREKPKCHEEAGRQAED